MTSIASFSVVIYCYLLWISSLYYIYYINGHQSYLYTRYVMLYNTDLAHVYVAKYLLYRITYLYTKYLKLYNTDLARTYVAKSVNAELTLY